MELQALGTRIRLDVSVLTDDQAAQLTRLWEWCVAPDADPAATTDAEPDIRLIVGPGTSSGPLLVDVADWEHAAYRISGAVTIAALVKRVGHDLLLHAAGLAAPDGSVLVFVGPSGRGKTTAVRSLGRTLCYVSDESIAIRADGTVAEYPKPLSIKRGGRSHGKWEVSPSDAGLLAPPAALRLGRVVLLERDPHRSDPPEVVAVDLIEALVRAADQTSGFLRMEAPLDRLARALTTGGDPVSLRYREIGACGDLVRSLLAHPGPTTTRWIHHPPGPAGPPAPPGAWARADYVDAIEVEGRVLVLTEQAVTVLDGVGALAWLAAGTASTREHLLATATGAFGPHPEAARLVDDALARLGEAQHLRQSGQHKVMG